MKNNKLLAVFVSNGDSMLIASSKIGINKNTLYKKVAGTTDFTAPEIVRIKNAYNLSAVDVDEIFFN